MALLTEAMLLLRLLRLRVRQLQVLRLADRRGPRPERCLRMVRVVRRVLVLLEVVLLVLLCLLLPRRLHVLQRWRQVAQLQSCVMGREPPGRHLCGVLERRLLGVQRRMGRDDQTRATAERCLLVPVGRCGAHDRRGAGMGLVVVEEHTWGRPVLLVGHAWLTALPTCC
jgi:hypothetical protein